MCAAAPVRLGRLGKGAAVLGQTQQETVLQRISGAETAQAQSLPVVRREQAGAGPGRAEQDIRHRRTRARECRRERSNRGEGEETAVFFCFF